MVDEWSGEGTCSSYLRVTDGCEVRAEAPVVRSLAFQLHAKEARVPSGVVANMYHICFLYAFINFAFDHVIVCVRRYVQFIEVSTQ